ncbi:DUF4833 domain-containing protein [Myxococcaceae bacterium GXIMD 01537]
MFPKTWPSPALTLAGLVCASPALAGPDAGTPRDTDSVFFIARSENRNQVHYGIRLDEDCRPTGPSPVHAYWRMHERGAGVTEPLLSLEGPVYGLSEDQRVEETPEGWSVHVRLRGFQSRPIDITVSREGDRCAVRAWTSMEGASARLERIFVKTRWPLRVEYVLLSGTAQDGRPVREYLRD